MYSGVVDDPFEIVQDSTVWRDSSSFAAVNSKDAYIRIGIVKSLAKDASTNRLKFLVEVYDMGRQLDISCDLVLKYGGTYNYEEVVLRGYKTDDKPDAVNTYTAKPGDMVIVACLNGEFREGIILGAILHHSRKPTLDIDRGPQYVSEFNGIETTINDSGEYQLKFKGLQTNISKLKNRPVGEIESAKYDTAVGGSLLKFDKTGGFLLTDSAQENPQSLLVNKKDGSITLTSGKIVITLTKKDEKVAFKSKILEINSETSITENTKDFSVDAKSTVKIKSPKVAIGSDGTELLEQIAKLIDALGQVQTISPVGPCTPLQATPQWSQVMSVQSKIKDITGSL